MPITPDQAEAKNLIKVVAELKQIFEVIDKNLAEEYYGNNIVTVTVNITHNKSIDNIVQAYEEMGWQVTNGEGGQYNERFSWFKFQRKDEDEDD